MHIEAIRFFASLTHANVYAQVFSVQLHLKRFLGNRRRRELLVMRAHMLRHVRIEHIVVTVAVKRRDVRVALYRGDIPVMAPAAHGTPLRSI